MGRTDLYPLQKKDIPRAVETLKDAFKDDPLWREVFKNDPEQDRVLTSFFTCPLLYGMKFGEVYATSPEIEGVAVWVPDRFANMTFFRMLRSGALFHGMAMGKESMKNLSILSKQLRADQKRFMEKKNYLYLTIIGVASRNQGQGYGSRLMDAIKEECKRKNLYLYLETEKEENIMFYEKHGLSLLQKVLLKKIHLPMWQLVYRP